MTIHFPLFQNEKLHFLLVHTHAYRNKANFVCFFLRYIRLLFVCFVGWLFEDKKNGFFSFFFHSMNKCQQKFLEIILEREKRNEFGTWILFVISVLIHSRRHHHRHVSIAYFFHHHHHRWRWFSKYKNCTYSLFPLCENEMNLKMENE